MKINMKINFILLKTKLKKHNIKLIKSDGDEDSPCKKCIRFGSCENCKYY